VVPVQKRAELTTYYLLGDWFAALVTCLFFGLVFLDYFSGKRGTLTYRACLW